MGELDQLVVAISIYQVFGLGWRNVVGPLTLRRSLVAVGRSIKRLKSSKKEKLGRVVMDFLLHHIAMTRM